MLDTETSMPESKQGGKGFGGKTTINIFTISLNTFWQSPFGKELTQIGLNFAQIEFAPCFFGLNLMRKSAQTDTSK